MHAGDCRSQFLSQWYGQQASALGDNTLTWKQIVAILIAVCRKSIADVIVRKYGMFYQCIYMLLQIVVLFIQACMVILYHYRP